jgi:hypothetical protein
MGQYGHKNVVAFLFYLHSSLGFVALLVAMESSDLSGGGALLPRPSAPKHDISLPTGRNTCSDNTEKFLFNLFLWCAEVSNSILSFRSKHY